MPKIPFLENLENNILVCDGAMGTMLYDKGVYINRNYDEINIAEPQLVEKIHAEYIKAGADIIETNTFGANRVKLAGYGLEEEIRNINIAGARLAKKIAGDNVYVAGSIGSLGKPIEPRGNITAEFVQSVFKEQMNALLEGGVDLFILETFSDLDELELALSVARQLTELPIIAQLTFTEECITTKGHTPEEVTARLGKFNLAAIGVNCSIGPQLVLDVIEKMRSVYKGKLTAQPNAGAPTMFDNRVLYLASPTYYSEFARKFVQAGVSIIGGCCGSKPEHILAIRNMVKMLRPPKIDSIVTIEVKDIIEKEKNNVIPLKMEKKSKLGAKLGNKFCISIELDPPKGTDSAKFIESAKLCYSQGVDAINVADSPRAIARMSNIAMCRLIQEQVGIETILHICCRDKNLIALQAELIGCHASGLRNLLIITGDPPKLGDYPNCTAVYDVDAIGLVRIANSLNHGLDLAGNSISPATELLIAVGANPGAADLDKEIARYEEKIYYGAEFCMTQPVYDIRTLERFLKNTGHIKIPILVGILPLRNYKNAEFLHNEVPGMQIPDKIRERMRLAGENGQQEGINIAQEALQEVQKMVQGVYLMPPFNRADIALEVIQVL